MNNATVNEPMLTISEVMEMAGISRWTLAKDTDAGKITAYKLGGSVRYKQSDAMRYAEEKKKSPRVPKWNRK